MNNCLKSQGICKSSAVAYCCSQTTSQSGRQATPTTMCTKENVRKFNYENSLGNSLSMRLLHRHSKSGSSNVFLVSCNLQLVCGTKTLQGVKLLSLLLELGHGK